MGGICVHPHHQIRDKTSIRLLRIAPGIGEDPGATNPIIAAVVNVSMNPKLWLILLDEACRGAKA
jgi:hypothetical protein